MGCVTAMWLRLTWTLLQVLLGPDSEGCVQGLLEEATFYDKQWSATWEGQERPKESEA